MYSEDVPRILLPPDIRSKFGVISENFLESLSRESLRQLRSNLRPHLNVIFEKVLGGAFEPPLSAYLRELPMELICFYIDRIDEMELALSRAASLQADPVPKPVSRKEYWLKLFTQRV
jgi:hypothetical protein